MNRELCLNSTHDLLIEVKYTSFGVTLATNLAGLLYNGLSMAALLSDNKLRQTPLTIIIVNLAAADLLFSLCSFYNEIVFVELGHCEDNFTWCFCVTWSMYTAECVDAITTAFIAVERYLHICRPFYLLSVKSVVIALICIWMFSTGAMLLVAFPAIFARCVAGLVVVLFCVMVWSYFATYQKLLQSRNFWRQMEQNVPILVKKSQSQLTNTSFLVCCIFAVCLLPITTFNAVDICFRPEVRILLSCLYIQIFYINNLVYMLRHRSYRDAYAATYGKLKTLLRSVFDATLGSWKCFVGDELHIANVSDISSLRHDSSESRTTITTDKGNGITLIHVTDIDT